MSVKVAIINGRPLSGKTTFEKKCEQISQKEAELQVFITSTIDFVKGIAKECGWDGTKTPKNRKFLSDLKDILTQWDDVIYKKIISMANELLKDNCNWLLLIDCREPHEIQKLKEALNATTVLIRRPGEEINETSNHADEDVFNYSYDLTIWNNSDIINLEKKAKDFMKYMKGAPQYEYAN